MTPTNVDRETSTDVWIRWSRAWYLAFYAVVLITTAIVVTDPATTAESRLWAVVLAAALCAAHLFTVLNQGPWGRRLPLKLAYVAVAAALWFLLVGIHGAYFLLLFVVYGQVFHLLPTRWAIPCSLALTAVVTTRFLVDSPPSATPAVLLQGLFWAFFGTFWAFWVFSIIKQSRDRRGLIEDLEATRKQLAEEERRAGTLEERGRMAREIHDTLAQGFTSIVAHLEASEAALPPGAETSRRHLDLARATARDNLVEARHLVAALRPEILAGSSLPEALRRLADRWSRETNVAAYFTVTGEQRTLPQEHQVALLRAAQEALSNTRKHAAARSVTATLSYMDDTVALDVQDDGKGFDNGRVSADANGGFGLRAMRERVEALGGSLIVETEPGEGSTLVVELPVEVPEEAENPKAGT